MKIDLESHENKLLPTLAQLCAAVMVRGPAHARQDNPHSYAIASRWLKDGAGHFQIRIDIDPAGSIAATGLVNDVHGEPLCSVFTLTGEGVGP